MATNEQKLKAILAAADKYSVMYFYSCDEYLAHSFAEAAIAHLEAQQSEERTLISGPAPSIEDIVAAAGTISFFGTKRIVSINLEPSAMQDADMAALCDLIASLENAVLVISTVFKDDKAKTTKKAKSLIAAAEKYGAAAELTKPQPQEIKQFAIDTAKSINATLSKDAAAALVERCGTDYFLLESELAKLAAYANYGEITKEMIAILGTLNLEADVFEMVRFVASKNKAKACNLLAKLIELKSEPVAIVGALSGNFLDAYRMKCAKESKKSNAEVMKDFGYKGSDWRLRKAGETAALYTKVQLRNILKILTQLDLSLKSSAVDHNILLQTALFEIIEAGGAK
ncbi:MAG: DNA polymerase III subunit delta [Oscillospiraceae bacterium]